MSLEGEALETWVAPEIPPLEEERFVRLSADWGRLHLDRPLPWLGLCQVPRQMASSDRTLIDGWPAYFVYTAALGSPVDTTSEEPSLVLGARAFEVLRHIVQDGVRRFGAFLVVELHLRDERLGGCMVRIRKGRPHRQVIRALLSGLEDVARLGDVPKLEVHEKVDPARPPEPPALLPGAHWLTIALDPLHFDPESGRPYPMVARSLEIVLDAAVRECWFQFARHHTTFSVRSAAAVGRRHPLPTEWSTDRALARINESFDFLLDVTPVNVTDAWHEFRAARFERAPKLRYRPIEVDPEELRRALFQIPIHHTEDPTLAQLFRSEQEGIDQKLRMLEQRDTPRFFFDSLHLYGAVEERLLDRAKRLLASLEDDPPVSRGSLVEARHFARIAAARIRRYQEQHPELDARVELRSDIASVMVAHGNLLVPENGRYPRHRVEGLLAHEVDTHVVTYFNGRAQPLQLMASGLSGADELQEGLAVLAEALMGGLTRTRLRKLAARVVAVHRLTQGAGFVDVFRELNQSYGLDQHTAFKVTLRVFRGGGLTKDAIYLRGLQQVLDYVATGHPLEVLLVGKFALSHIPLVAQLLQREVLHPARLIPHFLHHADTQKLLPELRREGRIEALLRRRTP